MTSHKTAGVGTTVRFQFTTNASTGAAVAPSSAFEAADIVIYKDGSATQRTSTAGWTMTSPFDSVVGLHQIAIDLSDNTDAGFYAVGSEYAVTLQPDETVDGVTVVAVIGTFRIVAAESVAGVPKSDALAIDGSTEAADRLQKSAETIVFGTVGAASTTTSIVTSAISPAGAVTVDDQLVGRVVIFARDTTTAALRGQATDITASTTGGVLSVTALTDAPVSGDTFTIV